MSAPMIMLAFLLIVFAPCLFAYVAWSAEDSDLLDERYSRSGRGLARMGKMPAPLQAVLPELPIGGEFEIRSFPKGLAQRRIVVRDDAHGPRLTIGQVREAAIELAKLGGFVLAHKLALFAAALVAAGRSVAAAAREAIEAAHDAFARRAWVGPACAQNINGAWDEGPPHFAPVRVASFWREESEAA